MRKFFYAKIALQNIKNNSKTYFPYILTGICTVMLFFIIHTLSQLDMLASMSTSLIQMLEVGSIVVGVFSAIFLLYTNSFLIKRRKKEIGLYNILGMEKKHIMRIMLAETVMVSCLSLVLGILSGLVFGNLIFMLLLRILNFMPTIGFSLSFVSLIKTIELFILIFIGSLLFNIVQVYFTNPINLLKGSAQGEKEPKTKKLITFIGIVSLGIGYGIAIFTNSPLEAISNFFIAVLLVILGTYALFTAGSVALLKLLKRKKSFYYKKENFIAVSGMIYRMKQNAAGLASICILSTAVIITLSTTLSLYIGVEDVLNNRFPRDVMISYNYSDDVNTKLNEVIASSTNKFEITKNNYTSFKLIEVPVERNEGAFVAADPYNYSTSMEFLVFIPLSDYNTMESLSLTLNENEVFIYEKRDSEKNDVVYFNDKAFPATHINKPSNIDENLNDNLSTFNYVVVRDENMIQDICKALNSETSVSFKHRIGFDIDGESDSKANFLQLLKNNILNLDNDISLSIKSSNRQGFMETYGGLFFIGIFLGTLFLLATVLIIYYKQVSEGYDDKERFAIMQKVGLSKEEVKRSINKQILLVFFFPILMAIIHITFAFGVITKLLSLFNLTNIPLFFVCTLITIFAFIMVYSLVYKFTARTYYKILS